MRVGVQFTGTVQAGQNMRWYTFNWPQAWQVVWTVVPTSAKSGAPQVEWEVQVERASADYVTYWLTVHNLGTDPVDVEARYAVLN